MFYSRVAITCRIKSTELEFGSCNVRSIVAVWSTVTSSLTATCLSSRSLHVMKDVIATCVDGASSGMITVDGALSGVQAAIW
jgi:hypothetical protein